MLELLWLLLPVAALSGWYAARRSGEQGFGGESSIVRSAYFKGINYLLNEQPDKAIEVFTRMVEVDSDTVETHLALGNLFRRRGEVDRAIRIHQNLIARPSLSKEQRAYALFELAEDYMRAGLLDRAESLFEELLSLNIHTEPALRQMLDIYQQEKEWDKAIQIATRLESVAGQEMRQPIAQFYCEQAEQAREKGDTGLCRSLLKRALANDPDCVRASILFGDLERNTGNYKGALKAYQRVKQQDIDYLPEVLTRMQDCYTALGQTEPMADYLREVIEDYPGVSPMLALADLTARAKGEAAAVDFVADQLRRRPSVRGLNRLIRLNMQINGGKARDDLIVLQELFDELLRNRPVYECRHCGFTAKSLYWQCPSCKSWATIKPIKGVEGE